jgi:L-iditol 2-dehydrogenase
MKDKMKAASLHAPGDLRYEEVDIPEIGPKEVLIKVKAAGNCGSDLQRIMTEGTYSFPCVPGHEFSGVIAETGKDVADFKPDDRVTVAPLIPCMKCEWCLQGQYNLCEDYDYLGSRSDGAFAEYVKAPAANLVKLPNEVGFEDGSVTDPAAVALHAIKRGGGVAPGETVVVLGAGPIGMLACQWSALMGAGKVIATDVFDEKLETVLGLGADISINSKNEDVVSRIIEETGAKGADVIIETAGSIETHRQSLLAARKRGRIIHIGRAYSDMLFPDEVFTRIFRKELSVHGAVNSNFSPHDHEWRTVVKYISEGRLKIKPLISHRLPLKVIADTFRKMYNKEIVYNKIIFSP